MHSLRVSWLHDEIFGRLYGVGRRFVLKSTMGFGVLGMGLNNDAQHTGFYA